MIEIKKGKVHVSCQTPGARIGYRYSSKKLPITVGNFTRDP